MNAYKQGFRTLNHSQSSRRSFLAAAALSPMAVGYNPSGNSACGSDTTDRDGKVFAQPARDVPLHSDADVIVCGAGPAGVTAAITAARCGSQVRLFEAHGCLGGVWTSSLLGYLLDFDKPGFNQELVRKLREQDAIHGEGMNGLCYQPEEMKVLLEALCMEAGVKLQLHTRIVSAYREGQRLRTIITESKSGAQAWQAPIFIDATGDGDVGAFSGCEFEIGMKTECPCQPMSMCMMMIVKDRSRLEPFLHEGSAKVTAERKRAFKEEIRRAGFEVSYGMPTLFPIHDNLLLVMMNHEYGINATDAAQVTQATINARRELSHIIRGLRKLGGAWEGVQIVATPEQIGVRDGRRILGRYQVQSEDLIHGARHDDAVVRATFPIDVHALTSEANKTLAYGNHGVKMQPYDIPLRAMIARDVDGLMMAGRCISGDFIAHASYRVTGNAVAMGEAAGATASVAAKNKSLPHEVSWSDVKPVMEKTRKV